MNKTELADAVAGLTGESKATMLIFLNTLTSVLQTTLATGEKVSIKGFGTLTAVPSPAREGRNPKTGLTIHIPASVKLKFAPSTEFKLRLK